MGVRVEAATVMLEAQSVGVEATTVVLEGAGVLVDSAVGLDNPLRNPSDLVTQRLHGHPERACLLARGLESGARLLLVAPDHPLR
ncbi:MAG: hypothetical protein AB7T31_14750 [Gemmatimonadales bacterium]